MKPDNSRDDQRNPQSGADRPQRKDDPRTGGQGSDRKEDKRNPSSRDTESRKPQSGR